MRNTSSTQRKVHGPAAAIYDTTCCEIHRILGRLPLYRSVEEVRFADGIYFFYEDGESSAHTNDGRIVRVGTHPVPNRLPIRLGNHYNGSKKNSVFRKHLGGALMRRSDPAHTCLLPAPGKGHWESQAGLSQGAASVGRRPGGLATSRTHPRSVPADSGTPQACTSAKAQCSKPTLAASISDQCRRSPSR
jgi:hypothetical protein